MRIEATTASGVTSKKPELRGDSAPLRGLARAVAGLAEDVAPLGGTERHLGVRAAGVTGDREHLRRGATALLARGVFARRARREPGVGRAAGRTGEAVVARLVAAVSSVRRGGAVVAVAAALPRGGPPREGPRAPPGPAPPKEGRPPPIGPRGPRGA